MEELIEQLPAAIAFCGHCLLDLYEQTENDEVLKDLIDFIRQSRKLTEIVEEYLLGEQLKND